MRHAKTTHKGRQRKQQQAETEQQKQRQRQDVKKRKERENTYKKHANNIQDTYKQIKTRADHGNRTRREDIKKETHNKSIFF